ncbi:uncharacterized protein LOC130821580 [Amaranthus tricolor]|uniref:uncharacterized protein LOC130821580 n=1 Tax=Amaranthus tricolor TaxID=29722 RepID=UPI0025908F9C|nr:uncharacterized protein LOC130821580 [Amaranthus tricolor]
MQWRNLVWSRYSIPKTRIICWLMALGKLRTKDNRHSIGVTDDDLCLLCATATETSANLFFECSFSNLCLDGIKQWTRVKLKSVSTMDTQKFKLNRFQQQIRCAIYTSTVYYIWTTRNDAVWSGYVNRPDQIVCRIKQEVKARIAVISNGKQFPWL